MKPAENVMRELVKWLTQIILVLGLFTFSAQVSEYKLTSPEPTKTELSEARSVNSKRVAHFKKIFKRLSSSLSQSSHWKENFNSLLIYEKNCIAVKFKSNSNELPEKKQSKGFLIHHSLNRSDEFKINQHRG